MTTKSGIEMKRHDSQHQDNIEWTACDCCHTEGWEQDMIEVSPEAESAKSITLCEECQRAYDNFTETPEPFGDGELMKPSEFGKLSKWVKDEQSLPPGLTITPEKDDHGKQVFAWRCGDKGGYSASREDAINDASIVCDAKPAKQAAYFIDFREEGGRATHVTANFCKSPNWLVQSGGLSHGAVFAPASVKDADLLIEWLNQWKKSRGAK